MNDDPCAAGGHSFVTFSGFGLRVIPRTPYGVLVGVDEPTDLDLEHGELFARIKPDGEGGFRSLICEATEDLFQVIHEVQDGPDSDEWHIETSAYMAPLSRDFAVVHSGVDLFHLLGRGELDGVSFLLRLQHPRPPLSELCGSGQRILTCKESRVDLRYRHKGKHWAQTHQFVGDLLTATLQTPVECLRPARARFEAFLSGVVETA